MKKIRFLAKIGRSVSVFPIKFFGDSFRMFWASIIFSPSVHIVQFFWRILDIYGLVILNIKQTFKKHLDPAFPSRWFSVVFMTKKSIKLLLTTFNSVLLDWFSLLQIKIMTNFNFVKLQIWVTINENWVTTSIILNLWIMTLHMFMTNIIVIGDPWDKMIIKYEYNLPAMVVISSWNSNGTIPSFIITL